MRHSWLPRKPALLQKLPRGPRSTRRMGSVGSGLEGWWWMCGSTSPPGAPPLKEATCLVRVSGLLLNDEPRMLVLDGSGLWLSGCLQRWEWRAWRDDRPTRPLLPVLLLSS